MAVRPEFSVDEIKESGEFYPKMTSFAGLDMPPTPKYNRPISPKENWKLAISGKKPYWIPTVSWFGEEMVQFRPRINPDNIANHQVFDGGPTYDYEPQGNIVTSSFFDVTYHFYPEIGGGTVDPNELKIPDINHWEDYITFPNLDELDWDTLVSQNQEYLGSDRANSLGIQFGLWERLMNMVGVVESCIALYEDEQKEGVHRFLSAFCDFYDGYIGRIASLVPIDGITFHDDWCHKTGPFFSPATAREMLLPYIKRVVESCHSRGLFYDVHLCGKVDQILEVFIEAGCDMWMGQAELNDIDMLLEKFKDERFLIGVPAPTVPEGASLEEVRAIAKQWVDKYKDYHVMFMPGFGQPLQKEFSDAVYEFSRIAYLNE